MRSVLGGAALLALGCTSGKPGTPAGTDSAAPHDTATAPADDCVPALPDRRTPDPAAATRGQELLLSGGLSAPLIPRLALDNLYWVWGTGRPASDADFQAAFQARYGLLPDPAGGPYALGVPAVSGSMASLDCLACHADGVAGTVVVGAGSSRVDLQSLFDDLVQLATIAESLGLGTFELLVLLEDRTLAAGTTDAFGLGMELSLAFGPDVGVETRYGGQQPAPWWQARKKDRVYSDGQGSAEGHRTMASMLLAFGHTPGDIADREDDLTDLWHAIQATDAPEWPFGAPDAEEVAQGAAVYAAECAACHGTVCGSDPGYPDRVVPVDEVGTDPLRATVFGDTEAAWINASWFGEAHPVEATGGYLAPPLTGVWASAPYLHNGSVPDLAALLDPDSRPVAWTRTGWGFEDYDPERVGWRVEGAEPGTAPDSWAHRQVVDTTRDGLSAAGHRFGAELSEGERAALLAFLVTL
jgi:hypothetical protein